MIHTPPAIDLSIPAMRAWEKLPENIHAEVINGKLYILPQPTLYHARIVTCISIELANYVDNEMGEVFFSPIGVFLLEASNAVVPDIIFISKDNPLLQLDRKGIFGPSDLHIEILSPGNRKHDLVTKKNLYEKAGVKEYWIVNPDTKDSWGYLLENNRFDEPLVMNSKIHIRILNKTINF